MGKRYIIALDQGTTSSKAVVYDVVTKNIVGMRNKMLIQRYPQPGWVEHNADEIWQDQLEVFRQVFHDLHIHPEEIDCIGITNQRETVVVWDKNTGKPIHNAIVWQCRRTAPLCNGLIKKGFSDMIHEKTGLVIDAYFSATKIGWILDNIEGARDKAKRDELLCGTVDSWLIWNLSCGKLHITDYSNASRTMLFNIKELCWDSELLDLFNIPENMLPSVVFSSGIVGEIDRSILGENIPISGIAGDQQSALFGQACFEPGMAKNTYGTGCFILMNTGNKLVYSKNSLLTTIAWNIDGKIDYALEGSVFNAGSAIQWLRDELDIIKSAPEADLIAEKTPDTGGVYFVPAFTGLSAPYWDMAARGIIVGLSRGTGKNELVRATLESIAYQSKDVFEVMKLDSDILIRELKVDGGASVSGFLMQFQADIMNLIVKRPVITETTAFGAILLAGLGNGIWSSKEEIEKQWLLDKVFIPAMNEDDRNNKYLNWKRAVDRSMGWEILN